MTPKARAPSAEWRQLLESYPSDVQDIALSARRVIHAQLPDVLELVDAKAKVIGYGFGTGYADMICAIILSKSGVKLGITGGAKLPDPEQLLEGSGKVHRYVVLDETSDAAKPAVRALLAAGVEAWKRKKKK